MSFIYCILHERPPYTPWGRNDQLVKGSQPSVRTHSGNQQHPDLPRTVRCRNVSRFPNPNRHRGHLLTLAHISSYCSEVTQNVLGEICPPEVILVLERFKKNRSNNQSISSILSTDLSLKVTVSANSLGDGAAQEPRVANPGLLLKKTEILTAKPLSSRQHITCSYFLLLMKYFYITVALPFGRNLTTTHSLSIRSLWKILRY